MDILWSSDAMTIGKAHEILHAEIPISFNAVMNDSDEPSIGKRSPAKRVEWKRQRTSHCISTHSDERLVFIGTDQSGCRWTYED